MVGIWIIEITNYAHLKIFLKSYLLLFSTINYKSWCLAVRDVDICIFNEDCYDDGTLRWKLTKIMVLEKHLPTYKIIMAD